MSENFIQWLNRVFIGKPNKELSEMKHKLVKQLEKKLGRTHA